LQETRTKGDAVYIGGGVLALILVIVLLILLF
jgi:tetrahydromethanopterin S-methyltransferase subunit F